MGMVVRWLLNGWVCGLVCRIMLLVKCVLILLWSLLIEWVFLLWRVVVDLILIVVMRLFVVFSMRFILVLF